MADKLFDDDEMITERFSCDCKSPQHILDVSVELADKGKKFVFCLFEFCLADSIPLKSRLKEIWNILRGRGVLLGDFYLRPEDADVMIEILERAKVKR